MREKKKKCVIYYGAAVTDRIFSMRQLPLRNAPATQRMTRVASAVRRTGLKCYILSPAIQPRIRTSWKVLSPILSLHNGIPIIAIRQIGVKLFGYLLAPFFAIGAARRISKRRRIETVVQYNFHPDVLMFALWCKLAYGSHVMLDFEDASRISWRDWLPHSEIRAFNQFFTTILQKAALRACDSVFMPSEKFLWALPRGKSYMIVRGCQRVEPIGAIQKRDGNAKIHVLLSGSLTRQNGLDLFFDAIQLLQDDPALERFSFSVCGVGQLQYARRRADNLRSGVVHVLGTLTNSQFADLYKDVDVCLVLQDPAGRFGQSKSPSKGYEALCSGKTIIVTEIGDFGLLPDEVCYHLKKFDSNELAQTLRPMKPEEVYGKRLAAIRFASANYDLSVVGQRLVGLMTGEKERCSRLPKV